MVLNLGNKKEDAAMENDKLIHLDIVRANWNFEKKCQCTDRRFVIDPRNREVYCSKCGAWVDPFDALMDISNWCEHENNEIDMLARQKQELMQYKPYLRVIKKLERNYRGHKMLPCCPVCGEPFYLEEICEWMGKPYGDARIKKRIVKE